MTATSTSELQGGSWDAFARLYRDHYEFVWRCALRMGIEPGDAADVVQETFMIALRRFPEFDHAATGRASSWLYAILHNVIRNHARGERRRRARIDQLAVTPSGERIRGAAGTSLGARLLTEFLDELDEDKRTVFVLAELEGLSGPEIAEALGIKVATAQSRLRLAREAFDARFADAPSSRAALIRSHRTSVPASARRRTWALLLAEVPELGGGVLGSLALGKLLVAGTLGVALVFGGVAAYEARATSERDDGAHEVSSAANRHEPTDAERSRSNEVVPEPEPIVITPAAPTPAARNRSNPEASAEALRRLTRARTALMEERPEDALAELREGPWPAAQAEAARALELGAMCKAGRVDEVRDLARQFVEAHPEHAEILARHCPTID
jgi:RNA polymerase sigma factor (sigma-70 family)